MTLPTHAPYVDVVRIKYSHGAPRAIYLHFPSLSSGRDELACGSPLSSETYQHESINHAKLTHFISKKVHLLQYRARNAKGCQGESRGWHRRISAVMKHENFNRQSLSQCLLLSSLDVKDWEKKFGLTSWQPMIPREPLRNVYLLQHESTLSHQDPDNLSYLLRYRDGIAELRLHEVIAHE